MKEVLLSALMAAAIAGLVTNLLVPVVVRIAHLIKALDYPGDRKRQTEAVPRLGGLAIAAGIAFGAASIAMMQWSDWGLIMARSEVVALGLGTLMVFLVGLVDDVIGVSAGHKLLIQVAAATLLVRLGWQFEVLSLPIVGEVHLGAFGWLLSIAWIVGVTNAINLIDGLDGLAGGVVTLIASGLLVYAVFFGEPLIFTVILMGAIVGSCLGFLRHNWAPAKIFMGDSGSLTLGFLLAVMSVHSSLKAPAAVAILVPILALGVPVMDTLLVMVVRFLGEREDAIGNRFLRMFHADRNHLHHVLERAVANRTTIVSAIYVLVMLFCGLALFVAYKGNATLGLVLVVVEFAAIIGVRSFGLSLRARRLSLEKRQAAKEALFRDAEVPEDAPPPAEEPRLVETGVAGRR